MSATQSLIDRFKTSVVPTYARFPIAFSHGKGTRIWDLEGREYLDFGSGIAVTSLGHAHPAMAKAIEEQAKKLVHTSNLYHTESQVALAETFISHIGAGKCFFCNSGAEANEALFKLARKFGGASNYDKANITPKPLAKADPDTNRFEILTTLNSFHGRTLAGIAATGQEKVKKGFEPAVTGFRHVPFNDLKAMQDAVSDQTAAILIEGIQGESGIQPASPEYLLGLRELCNKRNLLLLMDSIQCGMFRTGAFQSYQRILEGVKNIPPFLPDAISMAKGQSSLRGRNAGNGRFMTVQQARARPNTSTVERVPNPGKGSS